MQDCGHDVGQAHPGRDLRGHGPVRQLDNQWYLQGCVVDEEPVSFLSVLTQAFAMISAENHERVLVQPFFFEEPQQTSNLRVGESDLAIVWPRCVLLAIWRRRTVGIMRVVQVHPQEKLLLIILAQPVQRHIGYDIARALHLVEISFQQTIEIEMVIIKIETVIQTEA